MMKLDLFRVVIIALGFSFSFTFGQNADGQTIPPLKLPYVSYRLPNGLSVILHQDRTVPLVAVNLWYHVGSGDETYGKSGFAHLYEHMMFQGSAHTGEDAHFRILREIGASDVNGTTNTDRTNYFETVPAHQLETALWLESDRMGYFLPLLTEKSLANQKEVVRNERRQSFENRPYSRGQFALHQALYDEKHPYRYLTIGRHEDLERATLDDVKAFYQTWYVPSNATLAIAGDFDAEQTKQSIQKWFGDFPALPKPQRNTVIPTEIKQTVRVTVDDPLASLRRVHYAWHTPKFLSPGDAELDVLAAVLGNYGTGRLYKTLVHETQLAQNVAVFQASSQLSSVFHIIVDLKPGSSLEKVEALIDATLTEVQQKTIADDELRRAKLFLLSMKIWELENLQARANLLQSYHHFTGNPGYLEQDLDRYRRAEADTVRQIAERALRKPQRVEVITFPKPASIGTVQ